ncbi:hypothetical protein [Novosphingopyxis baekryungensis]|jgi:hypothetical protein|uniref:hypothetical protein n=1 Tax=Novosphingopyxis baekryungensis TaxID=279369 RepID=UPI000491D834|nr:hypothetical protein [Novosphingopyxis baekryungensis]
MALKYVGDPKLPSFEDFAKSLVQLQLDSEKRLEDSLKAEDMAEIASARKSLNQIEGILKRSQITIKR